jgi:hypothetical protein
VVLMDNRFQIDICLPNRYRISDQLAPSTLSTEF